MHGLIGWPGECLLSPSMLLLHFARLVTVCSARDSAIPLILENQGDMYVKQCEHSCSQSPAVLLSEVILYLLESMALVMQIGSPHGIYRLNIFFFFFLISEYKLTLHASFRHGKTLLLSIFVLNSYFFLTRVPIAAVLWSTYEGRVRLDEVACFLFLPATKTLHLN